MAKTKKGKEWGVRATLCPSLFSTVLIYNSLFQSITELFSKSLYAMQFTIMSFRQRRPGD